MEFHMGGQSQKIEFCKDKFESRLKFTEGYMWMGGQALKLSIGALSWIFSRTKHIDLVKLN